MKRLILPFILGFAGLVQAQSFSVKVTGGLLAQCATPVVNSILFCQVTSDPANPDGVYASGNGQPYFKLSGVVQQQINFSQIQGTLAPNQLPSTFACALKASVDTASQTATLSTCK